MNNNLFSIIQSLIKQLAETLTGGPSKSESTAQRQESNDKPAAGHQTFYFLDPKNIVL